MHVFYAVEHVEPLPVGQVPRCWCGWVWAVRWRALRRSAAPSSARKILISISEFLSCSAGVALVQ